jgi:hypothetical protein
LAGKGSFNARVKRDGRLELEHDPEKWKPVYLATNATGVCAEIMLKQTWRRA